MFVRNFASPLTCFTLPYVVSGFALIKVLIEGNFILYITLHMRVFLPLLRCISSSKMFPPLLCFLLPSFRPSSLFTHILSCSLFFPFLNILKLISSSAASFYPSSLAFHFLSHLFLLVFSFPPFILYLHVSLSLPSPSSSIHTFHNPKVIIPYLPDSSFITPFPSLSGHFTLPSFFFLHY